MTTGIKVWIVFSSLLLMGNLGTSSEVNRHKRDGRSLITSRWPDVTSSWGGNHGNAFSSESGVSQYPKYTVPEYMLHPIPKNNGNRQPPTGKAMAFGSHGRLLNPIRSRWQTMRSNRFPSTNSRFTGISRNKLTTSSWKSPANGISGFNHCTPCSCETSQRNHVIPHYRKRFGEGIRNQPLTSSLKLGPSLVRQVPLHYDIGKPGFGTDLETSTHSSGEVTR